MKTLYSLVIVATCLFATENAQAVLTLQFEGNGLSHTLVDNMLGDADATVGAISIDLATAGVGGVWGGGLSFLVTANNAGSSLGGGQLNVMADYNFTGGPALVTPIRVSTSDLFTVAGAPIDSFRHSVTTSATSTAAPGFSNLLTTSEGFFSTSYHNAPGPLDPFDFVNPDSYENKLTISPPTFSPPFSTAVDGVGPFIGATTFPGSGIVTGNLGEELRVANTFTVGLSGAGGADIGTVMSSTIVNPEPTSLLLTSFGLAACGTVYRRRRKAAQSAATC